MLRDKFVNSILKERQPSLVAYSTTCSEADFAATKLSPKTKSTKLSCILDFKLANSKFVNENVSPRLQFCILDVIL